VATVQQYKFQKLEVYQLALEYIDLIYALAEKLPRHEDFNLKSQVTRAATSIALNIAEGSTGQSDPEQSRFLGMALRSLIETVACQDIIRRRRYVTPADLEEVGQCGVKLFAKIQSMRRSHIQSTSVVRRRSSVVDSQ
jgi:four helix bundle protein